ncbi:hypothetical protein M569_00149, partial [Genlisea aurea]
NENGRTPGPSFWSWLPPPSGDETETIISEIEIQPLKQASPSPLQGKPIIEKEREFNVLSIPIESSFSPLPPLQSFLEVSPVETSHSEAEHEIEVEFSTHASEAVDALTSNPDQNHPSAGVNPDGTRWWKETGVEERSDGVICKWTLTRGISADSTVEWENKYWEAADELGYRELGSEKSGRDAYGNVWREHWKESLSAVDGTVSHISKTADKWGKNAGGEEWQEQWWEHYHSSGQAEKWAHKWCSIDPNTPVDPGHAHVWHERWGEMYDGQGGSTKYTDKWAERKEGEGEEEEKWSKWGDKWDERFDRNGHGVRQGEKWWEGRDGERWRRTWGEGHNGTGWVHKYGMSSSGDEHWDEHVEEETWYERFPHFGFENCVENSVQLREVEAP